MLLPKKLALQPKPVLIISKNIFQELMNIFLKTKKEVQAMGFIEKYPDNRLVVTELAVPPQKTGSAHAHLNQRQFPLWLGNLSKKGKDLNKLRLQAHSHGNLPAYFSERDIETIRTAYYCDWLVSLVGNHRGNFLARLDIYGPIPISLALPLIIRKEAENE